MSAFAASLSGLSAASWLVTASAGNVANLNSDGYKAKRVDFEANSDGTVRALAPTESEAEPSPGGSNVDLATEMVNLMVANTYFAANSVALRTEGQVLGMALDLKA